MLKEKSIKPEPLPGEFDKFIEEMGERREKEISKKENGKHHDPHWEDIEPADLLEEDWAIYKKFQKKVPMDKLLNDFQQYRKSVPWQDKSRSNFHMWLANQIQVRLASESFKRRKSKKKQK